ncbi:disulfide bond formation protein B [Stagnihabitans tardus]|uniref:Disulfide bond formation protein B n=1 Tax=Stagnihabitans tardus TaxID=2699202 RepID=A0AAE4YEB3_9RHOB|nr:disulfide bond formation protein B [Stagnihabitans tardus]NBZ89753.1 disulfide bond formation protein B [Stagnihabitans tardus]
MSRIQASVLAALGSLALLLGAYGFQYIGGLAPCHLCWLQRYPHMAAVAVGALVLAFRRWVFLAWAGAVAALTTAGYGAYHTGVERHWWLGPSTCTSGDVGALSAKDLLAQIQAAPVVQCDAVAWEMWGLSMASWNMLASLALAGLWIYAATRRA